MNRAALLAELNANRELATPEQEIRFLNAVDQLEFGDNSLLPEILYLFQDDVGNRDPLKELVSLVDSLDEALLVKFLVELSPDLIPVAKEWLQLLYGGLLGNPKLLNEWVDSLRQSAPSVRATVFHLFDELENELGEPLTDLSALYNQRILYGLSFIRGVFPDEA